MSTGGITDQGKFTVTESLNHRIIEWVRLDGTTKAHLI